MQGTRLRDAWTWGWRTWAAASAALTTGAALISGPRELASSATIGQLLAASFLIAAMTYLAALLDPPRPPRPLGPRLDAANRWAALASPLIALAGSIDEIIVFTSLQTPPSPLQTLPPPRGLAGPALAALAPPAAAAAAWLAGYFSHEPHRAPQEAQPPDERERGARSAARTALLWGGFFAAWSALFDISRGMGLAHWPQIALTGIGGALIGAAWAVMGMAIRRWRG
jgi:membrane-associated phospholipid phosphatase